MVNIGNSSPGGRVFLRVKARQGRQREFIWEIMHGDPKGGVTVVKTSEQTWTNMEAAYTEGTKVLARLNST